MVQNLKTVGLERRTGGSRRRGRSRPRERVKSEGKRDELGRPLEGFKRVRGVRVLDI